MEAPGRVASAAVTEARDELDRLMPPFSPAEHVAAEDLCPLQCRPPSDRLAGSSSPYRAASTS